MEILSKIPNANSSTADRVEALKSPTERKVTCSTEPGQRKKINMAQREKESPLCGGVDVEEDVYNNRELGGPETRANRWAHQPSSRCAKRHL